MATAAPIITFKAGICDFDTSSSPPKVKPKPTQGFLYLYEGQDDEIIHFCWRPRSASLRDPELDLVMVPGDGSFKPYQPTQGNAKKSPTNGRIFLLKFQSSSARHLFWLQSKSQHAQGEVGWFSPRDLKLGEIVDQLLQGEQVNVQEELNNLPNDQGGGDDDEDGRDRMEDVRRQSRSGTAENLASGDPFIGDPSNEGEGSREGGADGGRASSMATNDAAVAVQNFLRSMQGNESLRGPQAQNQEPQLFTTLTDLLPPPTTIPVIDSADQQLVDNLLSHLPPTLMLLAQEVDDISSVDPTSETAQAAMEALSLDQKKEILRKVLRSPQFHQSLGSLTTALRDGGLPSIGDALKIPVRNGGYIKPGGGVPLGGGDAVEAFLDGMKTFVKAEPKSEEGKMDTD
ncbi:MAG: hypothetical protein LQ337_007832 [Flavoplaca oasis]|nr:MAG: hypothetical protein LQ337_007832 [Flavoplaca oasis]